MIVKEETIHYCHCFMIFFMVKISKGIKMMTKKLFFCERLRNVTVCFLYRPSTVLLVISGGLAYAYPASISLVSWLIMMVLITVVFTVVCLFCGQDTQLKFAKFLTFIFAIIMSVTIVGMILQVNF